MTFRFQLFNSAHSEARGSVLVAELYVFQSA